MPELSIVIVNFNNLRVLEACLPAVMRGLGSLDVEVILSDNGSRDGSLDWVRANFPRVRILENGANLGFAEGNNRAFPLATGRFILLLNPDTVVEESALPAMVAFLREHPRAGAVGCYLLNPDGSRQISARSFPTLLTYFFQFSGLSWHHPRSRLFGRFNMTYWDGDDARQVDWVSGAALMIRREVLERVGGIDPYFFLTYDEVDWCHRMTKAGFEVWYTPAGRIMHLDRQSEPQSNPKPEARIKYLTVERNSRVRYFVKHHGRVYAALVEALHLTMCAALWLKGALLGTKQPPIVMLERRLLWVLYWRTACRVPRALWYAFKRAIRAADRCPPFRVFVNPYLADEH
ncbi:MAG: glycosyltransferase family 2 protein [Planctomycetes bacterium]|nr:glycosyltransferase family 2 protein [Planctomycetota bacterium]